MSKPKNKDLEALPKKWGDKKSWWMDLLKSLVSYSTGALITVFVFILSIDRYQHRWVAKHDIKLEVVKQYENAGIASIMASYDALKDSRRFGKDRNSSSDIKKWEDDVYDNLFSAENNLKYWFDVNASKNQDIFYYLKDLKSLRDNIKQDVDEGVNISSRVKSDKLRNENWKKYREMAWEPLKRQYIFTDSLIMARCRDLLIND